MIDDEMPKRVTMYKNYVDDVAEATPHYALSLLAGSPSSLGSAEYVRVDTAGAMTSKDLHAAFLEWREIELEDACERCNGRGIATYADTSTWRKDTKGQTTTNAVCEECWGSGDHTKPWPKRT